MLQNSSGIAEPPLADSRTMPIGTAIRHARMTLGIRLQDVATHAACSESLISKIENGRTMPSLTMLHRIAEALQTTVGRLCAAIDTPQSAVGRRGERPVITVDPVRRGTGLQLERLIPYDAAHLLQGNIHIVEPGGGSEGSLSHEGEEVVFVLQGTLELVVGSETYLLGTEDSVAFRSEQPHSYRNPGKVRTRVIFINTPPSF